MAIDVETKDCTALSDSDLSEMADMCAEGPAPFGIGLLSKQTEVWVLVSQAREGGKLRGFSFFTLERIGGTPCILIGLAGFKRSSKRETVLRAVMTEQYRRAVLAFPDEDVLVGSRINNAGGFDAYKALEDLIPRPGHRVTGEERAWGRRLAKRFGVENGAYDDRLFVASADDALPPFFDYETTSPDKIDPDVAAFFDDVDVDNGDTLVGFGWAMVEFLDKLGD